MGVSTTSEAETHNKYVQAAERFLKLMAKSERL